MEYNRKEGTRLVKYDVEIKRKELAKIRKEIIKACGIREGRSYISYESNIRPNDPDLVENFSNTFIGTKCGVQEREYDQYRVTYDEIREPKLAKLIKSFLNEEKTDLLDYLYSDEKLPYDFGEYKDKTMKSLGKYNQLMKDLINSFDGDNKLDIYDKLSSYVTECVRIKRDYQKNEKLGLINQEEYKEKVLEFISIHEIASIPFDAYEMVMKFNASSNKKD